LATGPGELHRRFTSAAQYSEGHFQNGSRAKATVGRPAAALFDGATPRSLVKSSDLFAPWAIGIRSGATIVKTPVRADCRR